MKQAALRLFACPECKGKLALTKRIVRDAEIIKGVLTCVSCKRTYPIINEVPRLLPDSLLSSEVISRFPSECRALDITRPHAKLDLFSRTQQKTVRGFGYEWQQFSQLYKEYKAQFLDWIWPLSERFFKGKRVLDAGCGTGRHAYYAAQFGAKEVVAFDLGPAIDVAHKNTKHMGVHCVQADIFHLPFKKGIFDFVYCIGVLHHLPQPKQGFVKLVETLAPRGTISIWVYGKEGNAVLPLFNVLRKTVFSRLPLVLNNTLAALMNIPVTLIAFTYSLLKPLSAIHQILPQYEFLCYLGKLNWRIRQSIIFDQMLAPVAYYLPKNVVQDWFTSARLKNTFISWRNKNSWRGVGTL